MRLAWLANVHLEEFTCSVPRVRCPHANPDECGAQPATAFGGWCLRSVGHDGDHALTARTAMRLDRRDGVRGRLSGP